MKPVKIALAGVLLALFACNKDPVVEAPYTKVGVMQSIKTITHNGVSVAIIIDKPEPDTLDVLLLFHGTVGYDSLILEAAQNTLERYKNLLLRKDIMLVSVAYPEENLLFGDNIQHSEAALLWLQTKAADELGISLKNIYLSGHSQGGYLVTRLNTMHTTAGVIANAPGPLNLVFRCQLEENGQIPAGKVCGILEQTYGPTNQNPTAYYNRSLLNFTNKHKAPILFIQGLNDGPIQMHSWPTFKSSLQQCMDCDTLTFLEISGAGHQALFQHPDGKTAFNAFLSN